MSFDIDEQNCLGQHMQKYEDCTCMSTVPSLSLVRACVCVCVDGLGGGGGGGPQVKARADENRNALDKASNVHNLQEGSHLALGLVGIAQPGEALIWHIDPGLHTPRSCHATSKLSQKLQHEIFGLPWQAQSRPDA